MILCTYTQSVHISEYSKCITWSLKYEQARSCSYSSKVYIYYSLQWDLHCLTYGTWFIGLTYGTWFIKIVPDAAVSSFVWNYFQFYRKFSLLAFPGLFTFNLCCKVIWMDKSRQFRMIFWTIYFFLSNTLIEIKVLNIFALIFLTFFGG